MVLRMGLLQNHGLGEFLQAMVQQRYYRNCLPMKELKNCLEYLFEFTKQIVDKIKHYILYILLTIQLHYI